MWGKVGLLGLSPKNMEHVKQYRALIEDQVAGQIRFTIFPKDGLDKRGNLSVLLRENFISFKPEWLPQWIITRSRIRGGLRVTHVKEYAETDRTRNGTSKRGWRLILLQGCPLFMKSLERFDQEHRFPVVAGHVIIRGGTGRPRSRNTERTGGRKYAGDRDSSRREKSSHRPASQSTRSRQRPSHRRRSEEDESYDQDYPALDTGRDQGPRDGMEGSRYPHQSWGGHRATPTNGGNRR